MASAPFVLPRFPACSSLCPTTTSASASVLTDACSLLRAHRCVFTRPIHPRLTQGSKGLRRNLHGVALLFASLFSTPFAKDSERDPTLPLPTYLEHALDVYVM